MGGRDAVVYREGREAAEIAAVVDVDDEHVIEVGCGTGRLTGSSRHARSGFMPSIPRRTP
jgi:hypothetical protein